MILFTRKINKLLKYLIIILLFTYLPGHGQQKLKFGSSSLDSKQLTIDKNKCIITPSFTISEERPDILKLFFKVEWLNKNNKQIPHPEKTTLFIKHLKNIDEYCSTNQKKLSTKPGLFAKDINITNSFSISPIGIMEIAPYRTIIFKDSNPPNNLKILEQSETQITLNLELFKGKEKNNSIDIEEKLALLSWTFVLPKMKKETTAVLSCAELERKYNQEFKEYQPKFAIGYYESKLLEIESGLIPKENLYELKSNLFEFKSNITSLTTLKEVIRSNPQYRDCVDLPGIVANINNYITDPININNIINKVDLAIISSKGNKEDGTDESPYEAFEDNLKFSVKTYDQLLNFKLEPDESENFSEDDLRFLYKKLKKAQVAQNSLYEDISSMDDNPKYKKKNRLFNEYNQGAIDIIEEISHESTTEKNKTDIASDEDGSTGKSSSKRSFPYMWVLIPLIMVLGGFGVYKYLIKGQSLKKKIK